MGGRHFTLAEKRYIHYCFATYQNTHSTSYIVSLIKQRFPDSYKNNLAYRNQWRSLRSQWGVTAIQSYGASVQSSSSSSSQSSQSSSSYQATVVDIKRCVEKCYDLEELCKLEDDIKRRKTEINKDESTEPECGVCMENCGDKTVISSCGHVFCVQCYCSLLSRALPTYNQRCHVCPTCRAEWNKPNDVKFCDTSMSVADVKRYIIKNSNK
jgi:hypothetical protein